MKTYGNGIILSTDLLQEGIFKTVLRVPKIAECAEAGQFVCYYCKDNSKMLPRPISICDCDREQGTICLVYRIAGFGTKELSERPVGDTVTILGPLGNGYGFPSEAFSDRRERMVIGGGIGIPPMLLLAKKWKAEGYHVTAVLGYRTKDTFLLEELASVADCYVATDDGSLGTHGTVLDCIRENALTERTKDLLIGACGPMPMLRGLAGFAAEQDIPLLVSLEERMACGIGACLGCITKSKEIDGHSHVANKRICTEGPVFHSTDLNW